MYVGGVGAVVYMARCRRRAVCDGVGAVKYWRGVVAVVYVRGVGVLVYT